MLPLLEGSIYENSMKLDGQIKRPQSGVATANEGEKGKYDLACKSYSGVAFACLHEIKLQFLLAAQGNTFCHTPVFKPRS